MHAETATIVKDLETLSTGATYIVMEHELIHHFLKQWQIPASTTHLLQLCLVENVFSQAVAVWRPQVFHLSPRRLPSGLVKSRKSSLNTVGVVATRIHP